MSDDQPQGYVYQFKAIVKKIANLADGGYSITLHTRGTANEAIGELLKRVMMPGEYDIAMVSPAPEEDNAKYPKVYT